MVKSASLVFARDAGWTDSLKFLVTKPTPVTKATLITKATLVTKAQPVTKV